MDQINFAAKILLKWGKNLDFTTVQPPPSKLNPKRRFVIFMDRYPALSIEQLMQAVVGNTSSRCELGPTCTCHQHDTPAIHTHNIASSTWHSLCWLYGEPSYTYILFIYGTGYWNTIFDSILGILGFISANLPSLGLKQSY